MENGTINEFIDAFSYQSVALLYKGEKYFSDGIVNKQNKYSFFIIKVTDNGEWINDVFEYAGDTIDDCIKTFQTAKIWNGKNLFEVEKEMKWIDW